MTEVKNRSEILFIYDIKDANPNGDPMDENKPRIDEETEINIVTDVRLKRTVRDYLSRFKKQDIFIIKEITEKGMQKTREERLKELKIKSRVDGEKLLEKYVDLRLFGATIAVEKMPLTWIGPVQFRFGRSLHKVEPKSIKGTSVMPSQEGKGQGTFTETQILPYSLISFYGIINENAGKSTKLKEEDVELLLDGIWNGTKNLITRSKIGQIPRLLIRIIYKEGNFHIGDLDKKIKLIDQKGNSIDDDKSKKIRDISEIKLDTKNLITTLKSNKDKIEKIEYEINDDTLLTDKLETSGIRIEKLNLESPKK